MALAALGHWVLAGLVPLVAVSGALVAGRALGGARRPGWRPVLRVDSRASTAVPQVQGFGGTTPQGLGRRPAGGCSVCKAATPVTFSFSLLPVVATRRLEAPIRAQNFGNNGQGAANFIGNQPGLPPVDENAGAGDPNQAGSLGYYPPALALVVKATSRIPTRLGGGLLGPKPPAAQALADRPRDGALVFAPGKKPSRLGGDDRVATNKTPPKEAAKQPAKNLPDLDAKKIWQDALAKGVDEPGLIIATADFLVEHEKFDHAAEFLKANLRNALVVRPWVYDALSTALKLSKGSIEDIERAELSFLDMQPQDVNGYLRASRQMADNKQWDRALAFCKQAARIEPNAPDAYEEALACAERGKNMLLEWAPSNLLSRDWPWTTTRSTTKSDRLDP